MFTLTRSPHNPILSPVREHPWEAAAAFNGCPIIQGKKISMVYRAMSEPELLKEPHIRTSVIGRATSADGLFYEDRAVFISPDQEYDRYGCEDPRVTKLGKTYYTFYTALGGYPFGVDNIKIAVATSTDLKTVQAKHLVTPFNAKGMALFPEKINGKMAAILSVNTDRKPSDICYAEFEREEDLWSPAYWNEWYGNLDSHKISIRRLPDDHLEFGAPPVWTEQGWLVVYSHIQRYARPDVAFGIEVVLLDLKNPRLVIGRTKGPFMVPETFYEHTGQVPHITFPSGALIRDGRLEIYYGAADTYVALASIPLDNLLKSITETEKKMVIRFPGNPIIAPRPGMIWENMGTINPAAIDLGNKTHIFYRAVAPGNVSTIGYAASSDGFSIDERPEKPVYYPRADFEKRTDGNTTNYGCEDPRTVQIGDRIYMTYTAYDGVTPRVAVSSISTKDFLAKKWAAWSMPDLVTPQNIPNKDSSILPEPINGKYMIFHRVNESICADFVSSLDFKKEQVKRCIEIISPRKGMWDGGKVGISTPPVRTPAGWLLLYHGVSWSTTYRVGAVLLDLKDPTMVRARTAIPLFEPHAEYEHKGLVPNVVFPCGLVIRNGTAYMYYGAGDSVIGVATMKMKDLMKMLEI
jgi:beta-1,2-mannobiose phosphorylase / 1,2-beta-oligomannan phosphorylase